jgi:ligand-binding sensor domain-containing protein/signal transduction histidine kinase
MFFERLGNPAIARWCLQVGSSMGNCTRATYVNTLVTGLVGAILLLSMAGASVPVAPVQARGVGERTSTTQGGSIWSPLFGGSGQRVRFKQISLEQGLSQSSVLCVTQDDKGFMWFGTEDGLNKYDGYSFTVYRHEPTNPNSLSHNYVWSVLQGREGAIWIATDGAGLDRFDPDTGQFEHFRYDPKDPYSLSSDFVRVLYQDRDGTLWVGTDGGGLNRFDRSMRRFYAFRHLSYDPDSLSSNYVRAIYQDSEGTLWVGTDGGGLDRFDPATEKFTNYQYSLRDLHSLSSNVVWSIHEDHEGFLWVGTDGGGLSRFDRSTGQFARYAYDPRNPNGPGANSIRAVFQDREGVLWIGTFGGGLDVFDRDSGSFVHHRNDLNDPRSLSNNRVWSIYEDREGLLWIGTHGGGVSVFDRSTEPFAHFQARPNDSTSLSDNMVRAIYEDNQGVLWVGTAEGGLCRYDPYTQRFIRYEHDPYDPYSLASNSVRSIHEDRKGILWVGLEDGTLERFDRFRGEVRHFLTSPVGPGGYVGDPVVSILEDSVGNLWVGTFGGGLSRFDRSSGRVIGFFGSLSSEHIQTIYEDVEGNLWVGTQDGLNKVDGAKVTTYRHDPQDPDSLSHRIVMSVCEDRQGDLWVGTFGGGLNRFDRETETFTHYREADGLPNDMVYGVLEDEQGYLWLSTNKGLSRFDPRTETFKNYDVHDGLQSNEFNAGAFFKSASGQMFFGGINGFNAFYPNEVQEGNTYIPPITLISLTQGGVDIDVPGEIGSAKEVTLSWPNNYFEFEFAALSYAQPEKNEYAYMLEGFEVGWNTVGTRRFGRYTNLPGGTYTLRLKGTNNDGVWNEEGTSVIILVVPPFWETWWFRGVVAAVVIGGILGGYRLRLRNIQARTRELERRIGLATAELRQEIDQRVQAEEALRQSEMEKAVAAERSRLARDLHDAVTQTLFSAGLIAEALPTIWEHDRAEGVDLLREVRRLNRGALAEMRALLLELRPAALVEVGLGELLRQLSEAVSGRTGIVVQATVEGQCALPADVHVALYRIAQEALNNVAKHAQATQVAVHLDCLSADGGDGQGGGIELRIRDDGCGFDPGQVPPDCLGLAFMEERAQAIGAALEVESQPGQGTRIAVTWKEDGR